MRERLELNDSVKDLVFKMSEGIPGAIVVLVDLLKDPDGIMDLLHLDDMNMRGSQIWVGYKDFAKQDIETFRQAVRKRDENMVKTVNDECSYSGELAVQSGGSYRDSCKVGKS